MGAILVHGVDISEKMLASANPYLPDPAIKYERSDFEKFSLPPNTYNLLISSPAPHYIEKLPSVIAQIFKTLTPGGTFSFRSSIRSRRPPQTRSGTKMRKQPPLMTTYLNEGPRSTNWLTEGVIKHHHTFATYITFLIQAGFAMGTVIEWGPDKEQADNSWQLADHRSRPKFLILQAAKPTR